VREGEAVVKIPLDRCIFNEIDIKQVINDKKYQLPLSEADKGSMVWNSEITLTGKLMEVLEQSAYDGVGFWAEYWWLLPNPNTQEIPTNLPRACLEDLMTIDADLGSLILEHRANVRGAWAEKTGNQSGVPPALFWANSMVCKCSSIHACIFLYRGRERGSARARAPPGARKRCDSYFLTHTQVLSRCFHLWSHADPNKPHDSHSQPANPYADSIKGGMIPFIDLINHDNEPNCKLIEDGLSYS
jgi:hypothetical protein